MAGFAARDWKKPGGQGEKKKLEKREDIETEGTLQLLDGQEFVERRNEERTLQLEKDRMSEEEIGVVLWYTDRRTLVYTGSSCREKEIRREKRIRNSASYPSFPGSSRIYMLKGKTIVPRAFWRRSEGNIWSRSE